MFLMVPFRFVARYLLTKAYAANDLARRQCHARGAAAMAVLSVPFLIPTLAWLITGSYARTTHLPRFGSSKVGVCVQGSGGGGAVGQLVAIGLRRRVPRTVCLAQARRNRMPLPRSLLHARQTLTIRSPVQTMMNEYATWRAGKNAIVWMGNATRWAGEDAMVRMEKGWGG